MVIPNNQRGHQERLSYVSKLVSQEEVKARFVGGSTHDIHWVGHLEKHVLEQYKTLKGANVVDIGCGIGRLTRYLLGEELSSYVGTDVVQEIMVDAEEIARDNSNFSFLLVDGPKIPVAPRTIDIICGFSVITHLLDEEVFRLFRESYRALMPGGIAIFSYLSFVEHRGLFLQNDITYETKPDILKFFWPGTLEQFAEDAGLETVEVLSSKHQFKLSELPRLDGSIPESSRAFGQCLIIMRRPIT